MRDLPGPGAWVAAAAVPVARRSRAALVGSNRAPDLVSRLPNFPEHRPAAPAAGI